MDIVLANRVTAKYPACSKATSTQRSYPNAEKPLSVVLLILDSTQPVVQIGVRNKRPSTRALRPFNLFREATSNWKTIHFIIIRKYSISPIFIFCLEDMNSASTIWRMTSSSTILDKISRAIVVEDLKSSGRRLRQNAVRRLVEAGQAAAQRVNETAGAGRFQPQRGEARGNKTTGCLAARGIASYK